MTDLEQERLIARASLLGFDADWKDGQLLVVRAEMQWLVPDHLADSFLLGLEAAYSQGVRDIQFLIEPSPDPDSEATPDGIEREPVSLEAFRSALSDPPEHSVPPASLDLECNWCSSQLGYEHFSEIQVDGDVLYEREVVCLACAGA